MNSRDSSDQDMVDRMKFLGIGPENSLALAQAGTLLGAVLPQAVDRFYARMESWPNLTSMFDNPSRRKHARDMQIRHWERLFMGKFDREYLDSVRTIGQTHSRIGLEPRWFLGAYSQILGELQEACVRSFTGKAKNPLRGDELTFLLRSLSQATSLDMDLVISVYLEENKVRHGKNMNELSQTFKTSVAQSLAHASEELREASVQIDTSAKETVVRSEQVDEAARNGHLSIQSMAAAMEEMSRSIAEIRIQTDRSTKVSEAAVAKTRGIDKVMQGLSEAVSRIDESIQLINDIAERTNILAINASIEAARAGNVGRGFSVVASEVRNLAAQTVQATESIAGQSAALSVSASDSIAAVHEIVKVIQEIDHHTATIAAAVEEQGVVTHEIAGNAQTAAEGAVSVTQNIEVVARFARETGEVSAGLNTILARMNDDFRRLNDDVDLFMSRLN